MKQLRRFSPAGAWLFAAAICVHPASAQTHPPVSPAAPPPTPVRTVVDDYYGTKISDPYRYMEDLKNPEVQAWLKAQNDYTRSVLTRIPGHQNLLNRIKQLDEATSARVFNIHRLPRDRYFYQKRLANEDVAKVYMREGAGGPETLLIDPARLATGESPSYAINYFAPSFDGALVAYGASPGGSEQAVIHIIDVATGRETGETIDVGWFGYPSWLPAGRSFLYNRMQQLEPGMPPAERKLKSKVYLHIVGTDPDKDPVVFGYDVSPTVKVAPTDIPFVSIWPGSPYAFGVVGHGVQNEITMYAAPLNSIGHGEIPWRKIVDVEDEVTGFVPHGEDIYLLSHKGASRGQITRTSLSHPDPAHAEIVVRAGEAVVRGLVIAADGLYVQLLDGGIGRLLRVPFTAAGEGKVEPVPLPMDGSLWIESTDPRVPGLVLSLASWTKAPAIYAYDVRTKRVNDTGLQPHGPFDDPQDVVSEEVKVRSHDGTMVPLSIVHRRGLTLDGSNPTLLEGYGAYGAAMDPYFDQKTLAWIESGGVYAVAHVRGGGEYGEDWHLAGKLLTKHNTWRDFIACAQYLIDHKYTSAAHLAGEGGSAGGITIGRAITERPDLFAAAIDNVGMSDMVRVELSPNGPPNIPEFGTTKTSEGFRALHEMSSYHHIKDGTAYPAVMFATGINDPRVAPWQMAKMAARMQAATASNKPVLLRVDFESGHGFGSTKTQQQLLLADKWSFLLWQMGARGFQPPTRRR